MNKDDPKISFVIPAYNCADTIEESVNSIFNGNFEDGDEVIIVNDASTDGTKDEITKLIRNHPKIICIDNEVNKGCPATRNVGISRAKNPLIFNLDSDNILPPNCIGPLKNYLVSNNADIAAFSEYHYFIKDFRQISHKWIYDKSTMNLSDFLSGHINPGPGGNYLYTKSSWQKIGGYWEYGKGLHEAWGFTLKQLGNGAKFVVLQNSYYFHRYGHDSLFITESKKKGESSLMATKMITPFISLLSDKDQAIIKSQDGSRTWFDNLSIWPLKLKNGESGVNGYKFNMKKNNSLKSSIKELITTTIIGKLKYQLLFKRLHKFSLKCMNYGGGSNPSDSGETWVLNYIKNKYKDSEFPIIFFDIGANVGKYSLLIIEIFKNINIKVFSFEPSKQTFQTLKENIGNNKNISLFNFGFGKSDNEQVLYSNEPNSGLASLHKRRLDHFDIELGSSEKVEIKIIDKVCLVQHIDLIHFLKLDIEGNELAALEGARDMIRLKKIDHIQFEFGGSNIDSCTYFQDFFYFLSPTHRIHRIVKDGLYPIDKYEETLEVFTTTNYLAILR